MALEKRSTKKGKNYMSIEAYAKDAGVSVVTIYNRIDSGELVAIKDKELTGYADTLIDADLYPTSQLTLKKAGRKKFIRSALAIAAIGVFASCSDSDTGLKQFDENIQLTVIDSCEYIYTHDWFIHKANCKNSYHDTIGR